MQIELGAFAFWFAVAAVIIAAGWFRSRSEAQKHQTLRTLIEKTGQVDHEQMRALFERPPSSTAHFPHPWLREPVPGESRRNTRMFGTLVLFVALGLAVLFTLFAMYGSAVQQASVVAGFGATAIVALVGIGLWVASGFYPGPGSSGRNGSSAE